MKQDPPIEHDIYITLEQILTGITKKVKITRSIMDPFTGQQTEERKALEIPIPAGIYTGWSYSFPREGDQRPQAIPADINFTVHQKVHNHFIRYGANVKYNALLSEKEANDGQFVLQIPTLDGDTIPYETEDGIDKPKVFPGKGLPLEDNPNERGDMIVHFKVGDCYLGMFYFLSINQI